MKLLQILENDLIGSSKEASPSSVGGLDELDAFQWLASERIVGHGVVF
jgi:hypothetical protein